MKTIMAVTFFGILIYAYASPAGNSACKELPAMEGFDPTSFFSGTWYLTHTNNGPPTTVCREFIYTQYKNGTLEVKSNRYKKNETHEYFSEDTCTVNEGSDGRGKFSVDCLRLYNGENNDKRTFNAVWTVLQTDYTNYAVLYKCASSGNNEYHVWVYHRRKVNVDSAVTGVLAQHGWIITDFFSRSGTECKEHPNS